MPAHHDVADFLVANAAEKEHAGLSVRLVDELLRERVECLFEVDSFGAAAGDDEAEVFMASEQKGKGRDQEIGAFVIEESRDNDDGYGVCWADRLAWIWWWREECSPWIVR